MQKTFLVLLLASLAFTPACKPKRETITVLGQKGDKGDAGSQGAAGADGVGTNGTNGSSGSNGHNSLISFIPTAPTCAAGGFIILSGLDMNDDAVLDAGEVTATAPVCNGIDGAAGGKGDKGDKGDTGNDGATIVGANGTNGINGVNALVDLIDSAHGGGLSCTGSGITVLAGSDLNSNGTLQLGEVVSSRDVCNGTNGVDGAAGQNGTNGTNGTDGVNGTNGTDGINGTNGADGADGQDGTNGTNGTNGSDGAAGPKGDKGDKGDAGADGANATAFTPVGIVDPCGDAAGVYDEVFLRLSNGMLLASFSDNDNGKNTRFSLITQGSYKTTDNSSCYFSVDANGNLYNEHY